MEITIGGHQALASFLRGADLRLRLAPGEREVRVELLLKDATNNQTFNLIPIPAAELAALLASIKDPRDAEIARLRAELGQ